MNGYQPGGWWGRRVVHALVLILAVAFGVHWAYELLLPTVPFLIGAAITAALVSGVLAIRGRRRW